MTYVFDTAPFSQLFKSYYRDRFPTLWERFDAIVEDGRLVSTREVMREIEDGPIASLIDWCKAHEDVFTVPTSDEGAFVAKVFGVAHFLQIIEQTKLLRGGRNADPFVIAKAAVVEGTVVTLESLKPNAARIPNICKHFDIGCMSLEEFMEAEDWSF